MGWLQFIMSWETNNMNKDKFNKVCEVMHEYLDEKDWKINELPNDTMFFHIDPLTGQHFRADHAFTIQSDRDNYKQYLLREELGLNKK
jgi:hypothetical protein